MQDRNLLTGSTHCLLIRPEFLEQTFYNLSDVFKLLGAKSAAPPLGLLTVAALLPKHWDLKFVDADVEPVTEADLDWADMVMLTGISPQEKPTLELIRRAHAKGLPVAVGGSGPTLQPNVYVGEADFVISGEAEDTIPRLLTDLGRGVTSGLYRSEHRADLSVAVTPRYDLVRNLNDYMFVGVQFSRGCPFACEFCAQIEIFGRTPRTKPPEQVLHELQVIYDLGYRGMIDFGYDNLIGDIPKAEAMLEALLAWSKARQHPFCFSTEATINLARQPKLLRLMQENDFRYLFVGIESGDEEVLEQTQKGQNTAMRPADAVKIFNAHGLIVYTGLILGFDSENDRTAENMLRMVAETGAFPALVLPLHALPNTQLSRRLEKEGRLFRGDIVMNTCERTDTATTGLNFVTTRPRTKVMRDLAHVLDRLYDPENHYQRVMLTAGQLKPKYKWRPGFLETLKLAKGFMRIATSTGASRETGLLFWRTFLKVLATNRDAIDMVVGLAAMHTNYAYQSRSYIRALKQQIAEVERIGEDAFNAQMIAPRPDAGAQHIPATPPSTHAPALPMK